VLYDLGTSPDPQLSGDDVITGDDNVDVIFGQDGNDRLQGNAADDYIEGDQGSDWIEGNDGDDDLVGGSSTPSAPGVGQPDTSDVIWGGVGDDALIGDNASLLRVGARTSTFNRVGSVAGVLDTSRNLTLYDLGGPVQPSAPIDGNFGGDAMSGGAGVDVAYGQDGNDAISGGAGDDYVEGNAGDDVILGDRSLSAAPVVAGQPVVTLPADIWPGTAGSADSLEGTGSDGQDDLIGGSSIQNFRDGNDAIEADGGADAELGDNGVLLRDVQTSDGVAGERVYTLRYAQPTPADAAKIRIGDATPALNGSTRFCTTAQATCEQTGAFGDDLIWGDGGDDTQWGQDGNDRMWGGAGDDDMYGELGDDTMFGQDGDDAMLGDRGGVVDVYQDGSNRQTLTMNSVPKITYEYLPAGTVQRETDLQHDIAGDGFVGTATSAPMPHRGDTEGGVDRIRGGNGNDSIHAGFGDDLANGDSGGDTLFGDDGADVLWGGKGCDPAIDTDNAGCFTAGVFDPSGRGTGDNRVDYIFGGKGGTSASSLAGSLGADILDWRPRGTYGVDCTAQDWPVSFISGNGSKAVTTTADPCSWFEMTSLDDADTSNDQHHQGIDWEYGGWDRDVLQADVADNGPNTGDKLLDWNGAYNLYTHCNSAYGGYNDVRQHSPAFQSFLQAWAFAVGAGQAPSDATTGLAGIGTSAFDELALVYPGGDNAHGAGSAYPGTPGHFDEPNACAP
jgi:Ca2+-binding RTX toxin-like protein